MTFDIIYHQCPNCKSWFLRYDIMSYTVSEKVNTWSDGVQEGFSLPLFPYPFFKCTTCNTIDWLTNCDMLKPYQLTEYKEKTLTDIKLRAKIRDAAVDFPALLQEDELKNSVDFPPLFVGNINLCTAFLSDLQLLLHSTQDKEQLLTLRDIIWQVGNSQQRLAKTHQPKKTLLNAFRHKKIEITPFDTETTTFLQENIAQYKQSLKELLSIAHDEQDLFELLPSLIELERGSSHFLKTKKLLKQLEEILHHNPYYKEQYQLFISESKKRVRKKDASLFVY